VPLSLPIRRGVTALMGMRRVGWPLMTGDVNDAVHLAAQNGERFRKLNGQARAAAIRLSHRTIPLADDPKKIEHEAYPA